MNKEELRKFSDDYAKKQGFVLQPDEEILDTLLNGLLRNEKKHGFRYCPCRRVRDKKTICPCAYHKDEIKRDGHCMCFLFLRK